MATKQVDKYTFHFIAEIKDVEIRKVEQVNTSFVKDGKEINVKYLHVFCDTEDLERIVIRDKDLSNLEKYKKGAIGTFKLRFDVVDEFGVKVEKMTCVDFIEKT